MIHNNQKLNIGNKIFESRLMLGTGKYTSTQDAIESIEISGASIVTVAVRRAQVSSFEASNIFMGLDWKRLWLLPNTAGCTSSEEAIRIARIGRELNKRVGQEDNSFVKLEVIPDADYLMPDPIGTLKAAEYLAKKDFQVLAYTNADPVLAKQLEDVGCAAIMPLGSPIGSGQGIQNPFNISVIIASSNIPVIIDAGIGTASEASYAMELGADGILMNTAIARANNPQMMACAMKLAVEAGIQARLAGRTEIQVGAKASSPTHNISNQ